jgi:hypothetical protein
MFGLRQFMRSRRSSRLLVFWIAYSLAIQTIMVSVGLGMTTGGQNRAGPVLCSFAVHKAASALAPDGNRRNSSPAAQCPFCFIAAQSAGHVATAGDAPAFPAYAGVLIATISEPLGERIFAPQFRHKHGQPRAPPAFSV